MLNVTLDGVEFTQVESPDLLPQVADRAGVDVLRLAIQANELATYSVKQTRDQIRRDVEPVAGDTQSIQGTIADNVGYLLEKFGRLAVAHAAGQGAFDAVMAEIAAEVSPLLAMIDSGAVTLTHHVKGTANIIEDAGTRATAVSDVLIANAAP